MTTVKVLATHEVVQHLFPRPPATELDELRRATGKAIDHALSQWSHAHRQGLRLTSTAVQRLARETLDEDLKDADVVLTPEQLTEAERQIVGVLQAFRKSEVFGLSRPRTRLVLLDGEVGVYAQPDYWDGARRFYEMKSFRAVPTPPDVGLQVSVFQLAFPGFASFLACFDRHRNPVETTIVEVAQPAPEVRQELLVTLQRVGRELGQPKVLEYIDTEKVHYKIG